MYKVALTGKISNKVVLQCVWYALEPAHESFLFGNSLLLLFISIWVVNDSGELTQRVSQSGSLCMTVVKSSRFIAKG